MPTTAPSRWTYIGLLIGLFGIPDGVKEVKFAQFVTYFGRVTLPAPVRAPARR